LDPNNGYSWVQDEMNSESETLYSYNAIGKTMVDMMVRRVVGEGLTPMCSPESDILGWSQKRIDSFRREAEAFWRITTGTPNFDYYGKDNYRDLQKIAFKMILKDGDVLAHWGYRKLSNGLVVPYMQLISGKAVKSPDGRDTNKIIGGVEIDQTTGKETAYYVVVIDENLNETSKKKRVSRRTSKRRLEYDLIQVQKSDASMVRGIPLLMSVRDTISDVNSYMKNHVIQSATQAIFTLFIEKAKDAPDSTSTFAEKFAQSGAVINNENGIASMDLGAGNVISLDEGEHANPVQRQALGDDFNAYMKATIGLIASSLGMSYEVAMSTYDASFSASRASINSTDINFAIIRREFAEKFCTPTWSQVIEYGILTGNIECPEWESLSDMQKKALMGVTWTGVKSPQVDPTKEVSAYEKAINVGICSREYATRQLFGLDYEEVLERIKAESEAMQEIAGQTQEDSKEETGEGSDEKGDKNE
jgi:lambda family phage portal protein